MTKLDLQLEQFYKNTVATRPQRKFEETITTFDRDVFMYDRDGKQRQLDKLNEKVTYEDHRRAIEAATLILHKTTQKDIAMAILTNRMFEQYRAKAFKGLGSFNEDYSFLIKKIATMFSPDTSELKRVSVAAKLADFKQPTLVQINHICGDVSKVNLPSHNTSTLQEWATKFNSQANESTTYVVAGLKLAA